MNRKLSRAKRKEAKRRQKVAAQLKREKRDKEAAMVAEMVRIAELSKTQARKEKREREAALQELRAL